MTNSLRLSALNTHLLILLSQIPKLQIHICHLTRRFFTVHILTSIFHLHETFVATNDLIRLPELSIMTMNIHISTDTRMLVLNHHHLPHIFYQNHLIPTAETTIAISELVLGIASKNFNLYPSRLRLFESSNTKDTISEIFTSNIRINAVNSYNLCCAIAYVREEGKSISFHIAKYQRNGYKK